MLTISYRGGFALCLVALVFLIWTFWRRLDPWVDLNLTFKALDARWRLDDQLASSRLTDKDNKKAAMMQSEQLVSEKRLSDMNYIRDFNSDPLPKHSHFGTVNGTDVCEGADAERCTPAYLRLDCRIRAAPKYGLFACLIHKSMSTILQAIMCFLYDEQAFLQAGRVFRAELFRGRFCGGKNEFARVDDARRAMHQLRSTSNTSRMNPRPLFFAVVRHPIDRFLSGFADKCIRKPSKSNYCNGCKANMTCFIITEYERFMQQRHRKQVSHNFEDRHFFPQTWRCGFDTELQHYRFLYYNSHSTFLKVFVGQLEEILKEQGVPPESTRFISDHVPSSRTIHSTVTSSARTFLERRLLSSSYLLEFLMRMFYHDFKLLDFQLPNISFPSVA